MTNIHLLPGLGFDERIFSKIVLPEANIIHLNWQEPEAQENLAEYAFRVSKKIEVNPEKNILIGHSFGGILAQEIAKIRKIEKVILISSIRSRNELPGIFKMVKKLKLHHVFTKKFTFATFPTWAEKHAYNTTEKKELFKSMVGQKSDAILQWSLKELSAWQGSKKSKTPTVQIHGDCDRTFPIKLLAQPDHIVKGGTHMMAYDRAEEIGEMIGKELNLWNDERINSEFWPILFPSNFVENTRLSPAMPAFFASLEKKDLSAAADNSPIISEFIFSSFL